MEERLQKLMAQAGLGSRRENEKLIAAGQVRVNGRIAKLGDKANPEKDKVEVRGRLLKLRRSQEKLVYIALNKPKGVISSLEDELGKGRKTVRDMIPLPGHLYPVGRLDKQSMGLMLMTNDGDLAHKLTHPRYGHEKTYQVTIEGKISSETLNKWRRGVRLDGRKTAPAKIKVINQGANFTLLQIVMREGRKRQIRRVANMLGHSVTRLVREKIGPLSLGNLKTGDWRHLAGGEISALKKAVQASRPRPRRRKPRQPDKRRRKKRD
ncbi:MAG: rRNA pseudouridine synthase [Chloroflexi bacterium]|nr:rRNA pseudouridine synthase [Chloroflexota bacterium]